MTTDQLRKHIRTEPFRPFSIHLADGRSITIDHPEIVALSRGGRTASIWIEGDQAFETVDLLLATSLKEANGHKNPNGSDPS